MLFKSKVDWWFYLFLTLIPAMMVITLIPAVQAAQVGLLQVGFIAVFGLALPFWLFLSTNYRVEQNQLLIKSGPLKWVVPIDEIDSVKSSRSLLSSPALSLDRLELTYSNGKRILVSPDDRAAFLRAIRQSSHNT